MDILQKVANIAQIVGLLWVLFLGTKTISDIVGGVSKGRPILNVLGDLLKLPQFNTRLLLIVNLFLTISVLILSTILLSELHSLPPSQPNNLSQSSPTTGAISNSTVSATSQSGVSGTSIPISTVMPTLTPTMTPVQLKCGCNDPILVDVNMISIDQTLRNMKWDITLFNNSGTGQSAYFCDFSLHLHDSSETPFPGTGYILTTYNDYGPIANLINAGSNVKGTVTFSFVPTKGVLYVLTAHIYGDAACSNNASNILFDDTMFIF